MTNSVGSCNKKSFKMKFLFTSITDLNGQISKFRLKNGFIPRSGILLHLFFRRRTAGFLVGHNARNGRRVVHSVPGWVRGPVWVAHALFDIACTRKIKIKQRTIKNFLLVHFVNQCAKIKPPVTFFVVFDSQRNWDTATPKSWSIPNDEKTFARSSFEEFSCLNYG